MPSTILQVGGLLSEDLGFGLFGASSGYSFPCEWIFGWQLLHTGIFFLHHNLNGSFQEGDLSQQASTIWQNIWLCYMHQKGRSS